MVPLAKIRQLVVSLANHISLLKLEEEHLANVSVVEEGEGTIGLTWRKEN